MEPVVSVTDAANQVAALIDKSDDEYEALFAMVQEQTEELPLDTPNQVKYDAIVSVEYILFRIRVKVEFEHLKVKRLLASADTPALLRGIFLKRDQYLAQVLLKLNSIREDVSVLQKTVYTQQSRNFK